MSDLEARYGFRRQLGQLTDQQLVSRLNAEVGNRGSGQARMSFLSCLRDGLLRRDVDSSAIDCKRGRGLNVSQRVRLLGEVLVIDR
ncbi:MAG: hypothetical protein RIK87_29945 [Fuerstiella sp.]